MRERIRKWMKDHPFITLLIFAVILAIMSCFLYHRFTLGWTELKIWEGFIGFFDSKKDYHDAKTLWDWLSLLIIPGLIAVGDIYFNDQRQIAEQKAKEDKIIASNQRNVSACWLVGRKTTCSKS